MARARQGLLILLVGLALLLVALQVKLWRGEGGRRQVIALQQRVNDLAHENAGLRQRSAQLLLAPPTDPPTVSQPPPG